MSDAQTLASESDVKPLPLRTREHHLFSGTIVHCVANVQLFFYYTIYMTHKSYNLAIFLIFAPKLLDIYIYNVYICSV